MFFDYRSISRNEEGDMPPMGDCSLKLLIPGMIDRFFLRTQRSKTIRNQFENRNEPYGDTRKMPSGRFPEVALATAASDCESSLSLMPPKIFDSQRFFTCNLVYTFAMRSRSV